MGLAADLNQADDRQERKQVPEPAGKEVWTASAPVDREDGESQEQEGGKDGEPDGNCFGKGIEYSQVPGPKGLAKIGEVREESIGDSAAQRQVRGGDERP